MNSYPLSIYEWRSLRLDSSLGTDAYFKRFKNSQITTVYLESSAVSDALSDESYKTLLRNYVRKARTYGITVQALTGDKDWAEPDNRYLVSDTLQSIFHYNKGVAANERITGMQFDIEPYNLETFVGNEALILTNYLETVKMALDIVKDAGGKTTQFRLGFAVPYWLDGENGNLPQVQFAGKTNYPYYHVADLLQTYPYSYLVVMAYRNTPKGENGTIALSTKELIYADSLGGTPKIVIAQETTNVEPASITFFGKGKTALNNALSTIVRAVQQKKSFGGVAIHDAKGYEVL